MQKTIPGPNLSRLASIAISAIPFGYFLLVRILQIPNYDSIGIVPYKDAAAWRLCAKALSIAGSFPDGTGNWCNRRPVFAEFGGVLFRITGSDFAVLAILALAFSISVYFFIREVDGFLGTKSITVIFLITLILWILFGANLFLSESLAIPLGVAFSTFIVRFLRTQSLTPLTFSAFTISLLQNTRPSNLFLIGIPFLLLIFYKKCKSGFTLIVVATFSPIILTYFLGKVIQISEYNNAGNAWATLYGLFHQNSDWKLAYSQLGSISDTSDFGTSEGIKSLVLSNLQIDPIGSIIAFIHSIFLNIFAIATSTHLFFLPDNFSIPIVGSAISILFCVAIVWKLVKFKLNSSDNSVFFLILYVISTTLFLYATYWKSEAPRVLSSALIFALVILLLPSDFLFNSMPSSVPRKSLLRIFLALICALTVGYISVATNHSATAPSNNIETLSCPKGEFYFLKNSIISQSVKEISYLNLFEWEKFVMKLPHGYLSVGLGARNQEIFSVQTFTRTKPSEVNCYKISTEQNVIPGLSKLGYSYSY